MKRLDEIKARLAIRVDGPSLFVAHAPSDLALLVEQLERALWLLEQVEMSNMTGGRQSLQPALTEIRRALEQK